MIIKKLLLGLAGAIVWGVFSHVVSGQNDFLSNLLSGLSNFVFFVVGTLSDIFVNDKTSVYSRVPTDRRDSSSLSFSGIFIRTTLAICLFMMVTALMKAAAMYSVDQMIGFSEASFNDDGYRDIQTYFAGYISLLMLSILIGYFFYLGSLHGRLIFRPIVLGCGASIGLATTLYLLYGAFLPLQIINYIQIQVPSVVNQFAPIIIKIIGWSITLFIDIFITVILSLILWISGAIGYIINKIGYKLSL